MQPFLIKSVYILINPIKDMETLTQCTKCGTPIKNIIMIDGKPYGTECATTILGIKQLPAWFKGGDWNKAKLEYDNNREKNIIDFNKRREITNKNWNDFIKLSKAMLRARINENTWEQKFISSIASQAGFYTLTNEGCNFETMQDAELNWKDYMGTFPYLANEIRGVSGLSEKQKEILNKIW